MAWKTKRYVVQFLMVREVEADALDDIQSELEAWNKLTSAERDCVIGYHVIEEKDNGGALQENLTESMRFVREKFCTIDREFLDSGLI